MANAIGSAEFAAMLAAAARNIRANQAELSRLDSHGGDGDHGSTMVRAMDRAEQAAADAAGKDLPALFHDVGWAIMGVDGGATGPLLGTLFMSMAGAAGNVIDGGAALAKVFAEGLAGVRRRTKAQPGDKTVLDALVPAVDAMRAAANTDAAIPEALRAAAEAAAKGAESTRAMQARFGRAKNLGEKSVGEPDPGATSMSLIMKGFSEGVDSHA